MAIVYSDSSGGFDDSLGTVSNSTVSGARNATSFSTANDSSSFTSVGHSYFMSSTYINRMLLSFDLSGESGTVTSATFNITNLAATSGMFGYTNTGSTYVCKMNANASFPNGWDVSHRSSLDGVPSSGDYTGVVTEYATNFTNLSSLTNNSLTLNSTAISDINSNIGSGRIYVMLIHSDDFTYNTATNGLGSPEGAGFGGSEGNRFYTSENTTNANRPYLDITYGAAATTPTDNAVFMGMNF